MSFETACAIYANRYTMEHVPQWAMKPAPNGKFYAPQYRSDREWYADTEFPTRGNYCYNFNQTWPLGQWLEQPYKA